VLGVLFEHRRSHRRVRPRPTPEQPNYGEAFFPLSWIKSRFRGESSADQRTATNKDRRLSSVKLISGDRPHLQQSVVASGRALVCISSPDITSNAIINGADWHDRRAVPRRTLFAV